VKNKNYTDAELLAYLEENGKATSYRNLEILKEGIITGEIFLSEDSPIKPLSEAKKTIEAPEKKETTAAKAVKNIKKASVISNISKKDNSKKLTNMGNAILESYLVDDCGMLSEDYQTLREDTKTESLKEIVTELLKNIEEKIDTIDTSAADRSRGDIKQLKELPSIQDSITQLEALLERDENSKPEYLVFLGSIIKSILYLNQYSDTFKDAYRNKKIVMIMKYQSIILSIISCLSYLLSVIISYKNGRVSLKPDAELQPDFEPMITLQNFIKSVDTGEFRKIISDNNIVREFYLEVPVEKMSVVLESSDYIPMIIDSIKNIYQNLVSNNKLVNLLYKATGVVVSVFSLRDIFYTLYRMKTKVSDMLGNVQNFSGILNGGNVLNKLSQFASVFKFDAENSSDLTKREINDENRQLLSKVKTIQAQDNSIPESPSAETSSDENKASAPEDVFGLSF